MVAAAAAGFYRELAALPGFLHYKPSVNYIFVNVGKAVFPVAKIAEKLLEDNILVRDCSNYRELQSDYLRFAVKLPVNNKIVTDTLKKS